MFSKQCVQNWTRQCVAANNKPTAVVNCNMSPVVLLDEETDSSTLRAVRMNATLCFLRRLFEHFLRFSQSSQDVLYWRSMCVTAFFFAHMLLEDFNLGDDEVAIALGCVYLSGKAETVFLKTDKLRVTAKRFVAEFFGADAALPADDAVSGDTVDTPLLW
jgi:hypothetical protein